MQKTKVLASLRGIFPPIHQPLPLDRTESHKLLESLKTSFRSQLDQEYGVTSRAKPPMLPFPAGTADSSTAQAARRHSSARATDRHLHAIINNPLFSPVNSDKADGPFLKPWDAHKLVFEKAVSRGLMNLKRAHGFLTLVRSDALQATFPAKLDALKGTGAGLLVIQWLRTSGLERDFSFLDNIFFTQLLLRFAVAEGLDHVVWAWITRLMEKDRSSAHLNFESVSFARLVQNFVKAKSASLKLDGAYAALLQAESMARDHAPLLVAALKPAWGDMAYRTTIRTGQNPPVDLFDAYEALGSAIPSPLRKRAHVKLYHPAEPSPDLAISYLSTEKTSELVKRDSAGSNYYSHMAQEITRLGTDTVSHLLRAKETQEASRIWELVQKHLAWLEGTGRLA